MSGLSVAEGWFGWNFSDIEEQSSPDIRQKVEGLKPYAEASFRDLPAVLRKI